MKDNRSDFVEDEFKEIKAYKLSNGEIIEDYHEAFEKQLRYRNVIEKFESMERDCGTLNPEYLAYHLNEILAIVKSF